VTDLKAGAGHIDMLVKDSGQRPKVSVVFGVRNEYPVILGTMFSFIDELEFWGYEWEVIVVDNMSTDDTRHILRDKFRRWVKAGKLKIIEFDERGANVTVRNIGARAATGDVVFLADGHIAVAPGTCHGMIQGWLERGGLWHSAIHIWGDTRDIRCYGYDLKLRERFWGNLSRGVPKEVAVKPEARYSSPRVPYYRVPMASHCALMAGREEYLDFKGYCEDFKCYGGGEPYLDMLWWLMGKEVWIFGQGLMRHAFGTNPRWEKQGKAAGMKDWPTRGSNQVGPALELLFTNPADKDVRGLLKKCPERLHPLIRGLMKDEALDTTEKIAEVAKQIPKRVRSHVYHRDGHTSADLHPGDEYLRYARGYAWTNDQFQFNFMLSAYCIGGYDWLTQRYEVYYKDRKGNERYVEELQKMRQEVLRVGAPWRKFISERQVMTLDELLERKPWLKFDDLV